MQENRQHTHKIVTQDIPQEILIKGKTQPIKASITMYYLAKIPLQYNHGSLQSHSHHRTIHVNKHESTHPMSYFQPSKMLPWLTCQALSCLTLVFSSSSCHTNNYTLWLLIQQQVPQNHQVVLHKPCAKTMCYLTH